jgi:lipid A 3-O-deacylase
MRGTYRQKKYVITALVFVAAIVITMAIYETQALADESRTAHPRTRMFGLKLGYGQSFDTREMIETFAFMPYIYWSLYDLTESIDLGLVIEPVFFYYIEPEHTEGFGITPRLRFDYHGWRIVPYVEMGVGLFYTDLDVWELGQEFNFSPQGEVGLDLPLGSCTFLNFGYRFHHISNAGMNERNGGVDTNMAIIGFSRKF